MPGFRDGEGNYIDVSDVRRTVNVEALELPPGATFDNETLLFEWIPEYTQAGQYQARFRATDDGNGVSDPVTIEMTVPIEVINLNRRPDLTPVENVVVTRGEVVNIPIQATDVEGNALTFPRLVKAKDLPCRTSSRSLDNGDGTGNLRVDAADGDRGDYAITLIAIDDGDGDATRRLSDTLTFVVTVKSENEPPVIGHQGNVVTLSDKKLVSLSA